jgi:NAD(P)-dependent dehydrogenase (short-subunit alcohol dehydrogenase family)
MDLVLVARRSERLDALASDLNGCHSARTHILAVDLTALEAADIILDACAVRDISLLVSNAVGSSPHERKDAFAISEMLLVNCHTPMRLMHAFKPRLARTQAQRHHSGRIDKGTARWPLFVSPMFDRFRQILPIVLTLVNGRIVPRQVVQVHPNPGKPRAAIRELS